MKLPKYIQRNYIRNNLPTFVFVIVFLLLNLICFIINAYRYRDYNGYIIVARGCGMVLNLDCALIICFVLRRSLTFIRNTPVGKYLPIDESITIHKFIGYTIFFWSILHTVMHLANIGELIQGHAFTVVDLILLAELVRTKYLHCVILLHWLFNKCKMLLFVYRVCCGQNGYSMVLLGVSFHNSPRSWLDQPWTRLYHWRCSYCCSYHHGLVFSICCQSIRILSGNIWRKVYGQ